ncbi:hypothetical protein ACK3Z1_19545, partial [Aeromonas caviae]
QKASSVAVTQSWGNHGLLAYLGNNAHPKSISKRRKIKCACWSDDFRMEMFFGVTTDANCSQKV